MGGGEALARAAHEFPPPRLQALRRTGLRRSSFALLVTVSGSFLLVLLVPQRTRDSGSTRRWLDWRSIWPDRRGFAT